jgi:hypothetical protein
MKILDINTRYVTSSPYLAYLAVEEGTFTPYYVTEIAYTDEYLASVRGDRPDRVYVARGQGATKYESDQAAFEAIVHEFRLIVLQAYNNYLADMGCGMSQLA